MLKSWDDRRDVAVPGDHEETLAFALDHFVRACKESIHDHGCFFVALSGGSTPKILYEKLSKSPYKEQIDWSKIELFWGDERSVPPENPESNYHMAMEAGLKNQPIPAAHIHRMHAEKEIEQAAASYEQIIKKRLGGRPFDLIMLGMGDDGHTASLFPHTEGLKVENRLVIANYVPQKNTWRMTLTFPCINDARHIAIYVLGASKQEMLARVLTSPNQFDTLPSQRVGTPTHKALWIADRAAAAQIPI